MCMYRPEADIRGLHQSLNISLYFLKQALSLNLGLPNLPGLSIQQHSAPTPHQLGSPSFSPGFWELRPMVELYCIIPKPLFSDFGNMCGALSPLAYHDEGKGASKETWLQKLESCS